MSNDAKSSGVAARPTWFAALRQRLQADKKLAQFALWGALGCLAGALLGELLLAATRPPRAAAQDVCLLVDCSGSMAAPGDRESFQVTKLAEVQTAATDFVERQDLSANRIAIVAFESDARALTGLEHHASPLRGAIAGLQARGGTAMDRGIDVAMLQFGNGEESSPQPLRSVLLFTDGQPNYPPLALAAAERCRAQGIKIVAIGAGDADHAFLAQITGDPALVFSARSGNFGESFRQAEEAIFAGSLVASASSPAGFLRTLAQTIGWSALLGWGASLALIAGQNRYVHRALLSGPEFVRGTAGGLLAGIVAGAAGQLLFTMANVSSHLPWATMAAGFLTLLGRIVGWALLGGLIGRGMALFVPNLQPRNAWIGGGLGGAGAAVAFVAIAWLGDIPARLLGASILGASIGLMVALFEAAFREMWLEVRYGAREVIHVNLGTTPVTIGSNSRACTIYARDARPLAVGYSLKDGIAEYVDYATEQRTRVQPGHERVVGNLTVTVRAAAATLGSTGAAPRPAATVPHPPQKKQGGGAAASHTGASPSTGNAPAAAPRATSGPKVPPPPPPPRPRSS